jgi:hypothetical protein
MIFTKEDISGSPFFWMDFFSPPLSTCASLKIHEICTMSHDLVACGNFVMSQNDHSVKNDGSLHNFQLKYPI